MQEEQWIKRDMWEKFKSAIQHFNIYSWGILMDFVLHKERYFNENLELPNSPNFEKD